MVLGHKALNCSVRVFKGGDTCPPTGAFAAEGILICQSLFEKSVSTIGLSLFVQPEPK